MRKFFKSATSKFSIPVPEKKRLEALPACREHAGRRAGR
jgi:hypothetical protein